MPEGALAAAVPAPGAELEASTWVPLRTVGVGPWRAGLSGGFTRRANSALLGAGADPAEAVAALDALEAVYRDAGQPCIVRVPTAASPVPLDRRLAAELDRRGYRVGVVTRVLARGLDDAQPRALPPAADTALTGADTPNAGWLGTRATISGADTPDDDWLAGWLGTKATISGAVGADTARRLLTGSPATYLTARAHTPAVHGAGRASGAGGDGDERSAVGARTGSAAETSSPPVLGTIRVAHAGRWAALSCLAVAPEARRRGLGRTLTLAALDVARAAGASAAFLQVEAGNAAAIALYAALGFGPVDEYAYLHAPAAG